MGYQGFEVCFQVIGQFFFGMLFMGFVVYFVVNGMIIGGGFLDKNVKFQFFVMGWQLYSFIRYNDDGLKIYVLFGCYDFVGLFFGIIVDIMDVQYNFQNVVLLNYDVDVVIYVFGILFVKQFISWIYLLSFIQVIDVMSDFDCNGVIFMGGLVQSMVFFLLVIWQFSQDDYMRDVRMIIDKFMQVIFGLSEKLFLKYNWLG